MPTNAEVTKFLKNPKAKAWYDYATILKPSTRSAYAKKLCDFFKDKNIETWLGRCQTEPKVISVEIKLAVSKIYATHQRQAHLLRFALKHLLSLYECDVKINGRLPVHRTREKIALPPETADRIISKCGGIYENILRFYRATGCDQNGFGQVQKN